MTKKLISLFLSLVMILGTMSCAMISASATSGVQSKLNLITQVFGTGTYFTANGAPHNMLDYSVCPEDPNNRPMPFSTCQCSMSQINWNVNGLMSPAEVARKLGTTRWQCCGFATYVFYNIFGYDFYSCGTVSVDNAKLGDVIEFDFDGIRSTTEHYAILLYSSGSNLVVYDANSDYKGIVVYGSSYAKSNVIRVHRAPNYDTVYNSTPTVQDPTSSLIDVSVTTSKNYYIKNKKGGSVGPYLTIVSNNTAEKADVGVWSKNGAKGQQWYFLEDGMGYKIHTPLCSNVLNPFADTPTNGTKVNMYHFIGGDATQHWKFKKTSQNGYYVICNTSNNSLVLAVNGDSAVVQTYTGADNQLWTLEAVETHTHSYGSWVTQKEPTCTETGLRYKTCSCGDKITETIPALGHSFGSWIVEKEATYYSEGIKVRTCSRCGKTESQTIPMLDYEPQPENSSNVRIEFSDNYLGIGDTFTASVYAPTNIEEAEVSLSLENNCFEGMWIDNQNGGLLSREEYGGIVTYEYKGCINPVDDGSKETLLFTITFKTIQTGPMLASCTDAYDRNGNSIDVYSDYQMLFVPESDPEEPIAIELDRDTVNVGETVKASVIISTGYTGYDLLLNYDTDCFELVSAQEENLGFCFLQAINDGTAGEIKLAGARTRLTSTKVLLTAEFKVLKEGTLELDCLDLLDDEDNSIDASPAYANVYINTNTDPGPDIQPTDSLAGDANNDNKISVVDAKWLLQNLASLRDFDDNQKSIADVNGDGKLSVVDAKWILQAVAGIRELGGGVAPQPQPEPEPEPPIVDGDIVIEAYRTEINSPVELSGKNVIRYPKINVSTSNIEAFNQKIANDFDEVYQYYMSDYANNNYSLYYDYIFSETDGYVSIQVLAEIALAASEDFSYAVFQYYYDLNNDCEIDYDTYLLKVGNDEENVFEAVCSYIEDEYGSSVLDYAYPEFLGAIFIDNQLKVFVSYYEYDEEFGYCESAKSFVFEDYDILNSEYFYDYFSYCI